MTDSEESAGEVTPKRSRSKVKLKKKKDRDRSKSANSKTVKTVKLSNCQKAYRL